jgi:hypothetical protein
MGHKQKKNGSGGFGLLAEPHRLLIQPTNNYYYYHLEKYKVANCNR